MFRKIGIITGSTRPGRKSLAIAQWVQQHAQQRTDADFDIVDIAEFKLPLLDEAIPSSAGQYEHTHTQNWAAAIDSYDGYIFVAPEYGHSISGALKNALDFVGPEWNDKAAGFVCYGAGEGVRAGEHLRLIAAELQMATVRAQVGLSLHSDFKNFETFSPVPLRNQQLDLMVEQVIRWSTALARLREVERGDSLLGASSTRVASL
ncbi:NADPH-dependent FMN reductase [Nesterenkonia ebinurensis]|uniref:NADPH-dependent FMN reductase n=1 Tax=Nesterenkonia ebinurensis TaxID=2608252 RepID=UPI00123DDC69|nr:NAD(P)H-dependent oxidoreductase [Nesterenkonia ebinurensis]